MKPLVHARISAKKYGGIPEDYLEIHDFMDSTKAALPDVRHRMILHNSFGCFIVEKVFGHTITNSDDKIVHVRDIAEDHVIEDLGFIPTIERCLQGMKIEPWMSGGVKKHAEESKPQDVIIDGKRPVKRQDMEEIVPWTTPIVPSIIPNFPYDIGRIIVKD